MAGSDPRDNAPLADLRHRLREKADTLTDLAIDCNERDERARLSGKAEGVRLALSFVEDLAREPVEVRARALGFVEANRMHEPFLSFRFWQEAEDE